MGSSSTQEEDRQLFYGRAVNNCNNDWRLEPVEQHWYQHYGLVM